MKLPIPLGDGTYLLEANVLYWFKQTDRGVILVRKRKKSNFRYSVPQNVITDFIIGGLFNIISQEQAERIKHSIKFATRMESILADP